MFNELKRYVFYKTQYSFDTICEVAYETIFIGGICLLLATNVEFKISYLFLFFTATYAVLKANSDLEYEIRTGQIEHVRHSIRSLYAVYSLCAVGYIIYNTLLFIFASVLTSACCGVSLFKGVMPSGSYLVFAAVHYGIFYIVYMIVIALTLRYECISVAVNFVYTRFLAYSGLVFPLPGMPTYVGVLKALLSSVLPI